MEIDVGVLNIIASNWILKIVGIPIQHLHILLKLLGPQFLRHIHHHGLPSKPSLTQELLGIFAQLHKTLFTNRVRQVIRIQVPNAFIFLQGRVFELVSPGPLIHRYR